MTHNGSRNARDEKRDTNRCAEEKANLQPDVNAVSAIGGVVTAEEKRHYVTVCIHRKCQQRDEREMGADNLAAVDS